MDTGNGDGKKTMKNLKSGIFKEKSGPEPSSKRWMRSDSKIRLDKDGATSVVSKVNSDGDDKKSKIGHGKSKKRKLFSSEDGSDNPSKRRLHGDHNEHSDETVAMENGGKTIIDLPGELLTKIIDMVPVSQWSSLESVSHRFQGVVRELWGQQCEIRLDELVYNKEKKPHQVVDAALRKFLIRAPNVASISGFAIFCDQRSSIRLPTIRLLSKFQHLQTVEFSGGKVVTTGNFAVFLESSASRQSWKRLDIDEGIYATMKSHNAFGGKENQPALNLEYFKFNLEMLDVFGRLLSIEWSGLKELVFVDSFAHAKEVLLIIRQCTQVIRLEIEIPECGNGTGQPSFGDFLQVVADLEHLSILKIIGYLSWSDALHDALLVFIQDLASRRRGITNLALVDCSCSDQIVDAIIDHLPRLKSLELDAGKCTIASLERLANMMGQLESLKLRSKWGSSNKVDGTIIRAIGGNMSNLQRLHLEYPKCISKDFASFSDLRKLKELRVKGDLGCGTIETWTRLGFGSCLETLELHLTHGISSKAMGDFLKNAPRLRWMKLSFVTDPFLYAVAESCPKLIELYIGSSALIASTGIQSVIDSCSQLKVLEMSDRYEWFPASLTVRKYRKITFKSS